MKAKEIEQVLLNEGYACMLTGNPQTEVNGFSDPSDYRPGTMIWLGDIKYFQLKESQSYENVSLLLCDENLEGKEFFPNVLICDDPRNSFIRLMELADSKEVSVGIHPTAVISDDAIIGKNVYIGTNVVIGNEVVIGDNCKLMPGSIIEHATLGNNCTIYPNCVIGTAAFGFRKNGELVMEPHLGRTIIEDNVEILSGSVIERGTTKDTVIGRGTKISCLTNVGHNVTIGQNCQLMGNNAINGFAVLEDDVEIVSCCVANRVRIGKGSKIGINSTVLSDIPANVIAYGSPAKVKRER